jgi:hypothetical protein
MKSLDMILIDCNGLQLAGAAPKEPGRPQEERTGTQAALNLILSVGFDYLQPTPLTN